MRQIDLHNPGWISRNIGGVVLISPDLDIDLFQRQMDGLSEVPQPFVVFVSKKDKLLNISARLRGDADRERLGNVTDTNRIDGFPIEIIDTTAFSKTAESTHFVAGTSPALIAMLNDSRALNETFGPDQRGFEFLIPGEISNNLSATKVTLRPDSDELR